MFDLTSSKLLILFVVALIVVGPKDLPVLLRTVGKYIGLIRRQAADFRSQFDEAMRDQELATLKSEMEAMKRDVTETVHGTRDAVQADLAATSNEIDRHMSASIEPEQARPDATHPAVENAMVPDAQHSDAQHSDAHLGTTLPPPSVADQLPAPKPGA
jgi:sec-independent protein translocase protein TatB